MRIRTLFITSLLLVSIVTFAGAQGKKKAQPPKPLTPQQEEQLRAKYPIIPPHPSFYIQPITETPGVFSLLLSDANNRSVAGTYRAAQLVIFEAVLEAALQFGETGEDIGKTTRFADKNERGLIVDVEKTPKASRFFVTLSYLQSKITVDAGSIVRGDKEEHKVLARDLLEGIRNARTSS
jgi:hypothetical protein